MNKKQGFLLVGFILGGAIGTYLNPGSPIPQAVVYIVGIAAFGVLYAWASLHERRM